MFFFNNKTSKKSKHKEISYESGSIVLFDNTIAFNKNLASITMKEYGEIKSMMLDIVDKNDSLNIDIRTLTITNSAVIALISVIAKITRIELHKGIKFFIDSNQDWQIKFIKNVFKNAGPCEVEDANNSVDIESLNINYFKSERMN